MPTDSCLAVVDVVIVIKPRKLQGRLPAAFIDVGRGNPNPKEVFGDAHFYGKIVAPTLLPYLCAIVLSFEFF